MWPIETSVYYIKKFNKSKNRTRGDCVSMIDILNVSICEETRDNGEDKMGNM